MRENLQNLRETDSENVIMALIQKIVPQFNKDTAVFFICLSIAFMFWTLNRMQTPFDRTVTVPISYSLPDQMAFEEPPLQNAQIVIQANGWDLFSRPIGGINAVLNADSVQEIPLRTLASAQLGVKVLNCEPESISVIVNDAEEKVIPITPVTQIGFAKGYSMSERVRLYPSSVRVIGPKKLIAGLTEIQTDTIVVRNLRGEVKMNINLNTNPLLRFDVMQTRAVLKAEQFTEKTIIAEINLENAPMKLKVFPNKIKIDCAVPLSKYNDVNASQFVLTVDVNLANAKGKSNNIPITILKKSEYAQNIKLTPETVEFYFEK